jgi:HEAT repeat protein
MDEPDAAGVLVRLADDPDPVVAAKAIDSIGTYHEDPLVARLLRRKLSGPDGRVSLAAATTLCFGRDAAGFPVLLRLTRHPDDLVRLQAIAMLVDRTVYSYDPAKAEAALLERLGAEKEPRLIQRTLESLGSYQSDRVRAAVRPFLEHPDPIVRKRAAFTLEQSAGK